jgi:hypothetical protein
VEGGGGGSVHGKTESHAGKVTAIFVAKNGRENIKTIYSMFLPMFKRIHT